MSLVKIIVHSLGNNKESVFAVEFIADEEDKSLVYFKNPTSCKKPNGFFNPTIKGTKKINIKSIMENYDVDTNFCINTSGKKIYDLDLKTFPDKNVRELTNLELYVTNSDTGGNTSGDTSGEISRDPIFKIRELPVEGNCPWENSIVTQNSVFIYSKPFSNFTKFGFEFYGKYFPSIEHLIMFRRMQLTVFNGDPEKTYETMQEGIRNGWSTGVMKRYCISLIKKHGVHNPECDKMDPYLLYALYRKILAYPGLHSFFLANSEKTFYEVAPHDSVWVIKETFDLEAKENKDYIECLEKSAEEYGETRNVFGKYLTSVAREIPSVPKKW